jgi:hypothetical protein
MGCATSVDSAFAEAIARSQYNGDVVCTRDRTAFLLDWDDTLFPSTWLKENLHMPQDVLRWSNSAVQSHFRRLLVFLTMATQYGHVFIVTAANPGFVRKACSVLYPSLYQKLQDLGVTILYSRPAGQDAPVEEDKALMFSLALGHVRPIPSVCARFYDQDLIPALDGRAAVASNWDQVFCVGDASEDLSALRSALQHHKPCRKKLVKFKDDPAVQDLCRQVSLLIQYLPALARVDGSCVLDMQRPLEEQIEPELGSLMRRYTLEPQCDREDVKPDHSLRPSPYSGSTVASCGDAEALSSSSEGSHQRDRNSSSSTVTSTCAESDRPLYEWV